MYWPVSCLRDWSGVAKSLTKDRQLRTDWHKYWEFNLDQSEVKRHRGDAKKPGTQYELAPQGQRRYNGI
jgi:hypothetical protein